MGQEKYLRPGTTKTLALLLGLLLSGKFGPLSCHLSRGARKACISKS